MVSKFETMLDEAENERMHLMIFVKIAKPTPLNDLSFYRAIILYSNVFIIYIISKRTAHRIVGYFEEEAVYSYTEFLDELDSGKMKNEPAPKIAIDYYNLPLHATLRDVVVRVREDEAGHRDVNHSSANILNNK